MALTSKIGKRTAEQARCTAHSSRTGKPCRAPAIRGGTVCTGHGGRAPQVKAAAARRLQKMLDDILDPNRVLEEIACIAFFDPGTVLDADGNLLPIGKWPEEARRALASSEIVQRNLVSGDGALDTVLKTKFWDKAKALDMAAKHHALLTEKVEVSGQVDVVERLVAGRKRVAAARG